MSAHRVTQAWSSTVRLVVQDGAALPEAAAELDALLVRIGRAANRFRTDSELSRLNASAGQRVAVSPLLADMINAALDAARWTGGACDPTVGAAVVAAGYDRDIAEVTRQPGRIGRASAAAWTDVEFDDGHVSVPAGVALDLGATGKAYAADTAARWIYQHLGTPTLVEIGGDVAVAGTYDDGWTVRVAEREGGSGQLITLHSGGVATSTTTIRRWPGGHHLIDPRTGKPADSPWRTATVCGISAVAANAAGTAAIVLGDQAPGWLAEHHLPARLIAQDGSVTTTAAWPVPRPIEPIVDFAAARRQLVISC